MTGSNVANGHHLSRCHVDSDHSVSKAEITTTRVKYVSVPKQTLNLIIAAPGAFLSSSPLTPSTPPQSWLTCLRMSSSSWSRQAPSTHSTIILHRCLALSSFSSLFSNPAAEATLVTVNPQIRAADQIANGGKVALALPEDEKHF